MESLNKKIKIISNEINNKKRKLSPALEEILDTLQCKFKTEDVAKKNCFCKVNFK